MRRHFKTQHPNLAELGANEKRLKAKSLGANLRSEHIYLKPSSSESAAATKI